MRASSTVSCPFQFHQNNILTWLNLQHSLNPSVKLDKHSSKILEETCPTLNFSKQASCSKIFIRIVTGDMNPIGSNNDAATFKIFLFVGGSSLLINTNLSKVRIRLSSELFHLIPSTLHSFDFN